MTGVRLGPHHSRTERLAQQALIANAPTNNATTNSVKQSLSATAPVAPSGEPTSFSSSVADTIDHGPTTIKTLTGEEERQDRVRAATPATPLAVKVDRVPDPKADSPVSSTPLPDTDDAFNEEIAKEQWELISAKAPRLAPTTFDAGKPTHDMFDRIAKIYVRNAGYVETFEIHEGVLVFYSDYFRAILRDSEESRQEPDVTLINIYAHTFQAFHGWLYTRRLDHVAFDDPTQPVSPLIRLWILADYLLVPLLKNQIIDTYFDAFAKHVSFPFESIAYAYRNTSYGSRLRLALVDSLALTQRDGVELEGLINNEQHADNVSATRFYMELCRAVLNRGSGFEPYDAKSIREMDKCGYHEHPQGVDCKHPVLANDEG